MTGGSRPAASNLNPRAGQTVATGALIGIGDNQEFNVYNASGSTDLLVDVSGSFEYFPSLLTLPPALARPAAARGRSGGRSGRRGPEHGRPGRPPGQRGTGAALDRRLTRRSGPVHPRPRGSARVSVDRRPKPSLSRSLTPDAQPSTLPTSEGEVR